MKRGVVVLVVLTSLLVAMGASVTAQDNDAWIPGLASFVIPGLGQLLNDQMDKAILHFGVFVALDVGAYYLTAFLPVNYWYARVSLVGLAHLAWALYSGYDAYTVAKEKGFTIGFTQDGLTLAYQF
jgi:hypothetical protein